jgi:hypothetical protein
MLPHARTYLTKQALLAVFRAWRFGGADDVISDGIHQGARGKVIDVDGMASIEHAGPRVPRV